MSINFNFPTFSEDMLDTEKGRKQLFEALYQLTRQLKWVLSNLGEENFSEEYKESTDITALSEKVSGNTASIRALSGKVNNSVNVHSVVKAINDSDEIIKIVSEKLSAIPGQGLLTNNYSGSGTVRFLGLNEENELQLFDCVIYDSVAEKPSSQYSINLVVIE